MKRSGFLFIAMSSLLSISVVQAAAERQHIDHRALEIARKGPPSGTPTPNGTMTANYSNTLVGAPTWNRPFADCSGLSGVGVGVPHHVQPFSVGAAGSYDLSSTQTGGWDGFLLLYQNSFDPANGLTNCIGGNDDGSGGIGTSDILGATLAVGTQYFLVTTSFEPGEEGTFDNVINGPGVITLGSLSGNADLSIAVAAPGGISTGGNFNIVLTAANAGPDEAANVTVTDVVSSNLTFVSSTCGATFAANTVTWAIGTMASGSNQACTVTVSLGPTCGVVTNNASIASATTFDPQSANNSASTTNAGSNSIQDPGFEGGTPNAFWTEASTNFGTPLCDAACGFGNGTGPRSGSFWLWLGGFGDGTETGSVTQSVTIPTGAQLTFFAEFPVCSNGASDFVRLQIDGTEVWREDATSARCNTVGYQLVTVDVSAFDDGLPHTLSFNSTTIGGGAVSNFFIDDIVLTTPTCTTGVTAPVFGYTPAAGGSVAFSGGGAIGSTATGTIAVNVATAGNGKGAAATTTATCTAPGGFSGFGQTVTAEGAGAISGGPLSGTCVLGAAAVTATMTCIENQGGTPVTRTFELTCPAGTATPLTSTPISGSTVALPPQTAGGVATSSVIEFQNPGAAAATVTCTAPTAPFSATPLSFQVPAAGTASTTVSYTSAAIGTFTGTLTCTAGAQTFTFNLTGSTVGVAQGVPAIGDGARHLLMLVMLMFGVIAVGASTRRG